MYRFKVTCPSCRSENVLPARKLLVRVADRAMTDAECVFGCLTYHRCVVIGVDRDGVSAMLMAGVAWLALAEPGVAHPEQPAAGPVLTVDDLLDLHTALEQEETWFENLHGSVSADGH
jgi:beta-phosphoglucomutase-like phosphatase (HAD superfamily)